MKKKLPYPLNLTALLNKHTRIGKIMKIVQQTTLEHPKITKAGLLNYVSQEYNSQDLGILDYFEYEKALDFLELYKDKK